MTSQLGFQPPVRSSPRAVCWRGSPRRAVVSFQLQQVAHVLERRADHAARPEDPVDLARLPPAIRRLTRSVMSADQRR